MGFEKNALHLAEWTPDGPEHMTLKAVVGVVALDGPCAAGAYASEPDCMNLARTYVLKRLLEAQGA